MAEEVESKSFLQAVIRHFLRIVIAFALVTTVFFVMDIPFWATSQTETTGTLAWILSSLFLSISSYLLSGDMGKTD